MIGYINLPLMLLAKFPPTKAGLATVGYTLYNPDGTVYIARSTVRHDGGNGRYTATPVIAEAWSGYVVWDTGEAVPLESEEDIAVSPAPASATDPRLDNLPVDLSPVLTAIDTLGTGVATETTQQTILDRLTPNVPADHVVVIPAAAEPGLQTLYGRVIDSEGALAANVTITAVLNGVNVIDNDFLIHQVLDNISDANGQWSLKVVCGARYNITIPEHGKTYQNLKITSAATAALASYVTKAVTP